MHTICGGKMKYSHYDFNTHYIWKREMQYMHENLRMQTICGGKVQYPHYDPNPHYLWKAKMLNPYIKHGTFLVEFDD
jgi:hypothetical protein